jgi:hypothetical protein
MPSQPSGTLPLLLKPFVLAAFHLFLRNIFYMRRDPPVVA